MEERQIALTLVTLLESDDLPCRKLIFTSEANTVNVGRASKREEKHLMPAQNNAYFDSRVMSRNHATLSLSLDMKRIVVRDIGSMHGTFLNGKKILENEDYAIISGDVLTFGTEISRGSEVVSPQNVRCEYELVGDLHSSIKTEASKPTTNRFSVPDDDYESEELDVVYESLNARISVSDPSGVANADESRSISRANPSVQPMSCDQVQSHDLEDSEPNFRLLAGSQKSLSDLTRPSQSVDNKRMSSPCSELDESVRSREDSQSLEVMEDWSGAHCILDEEGPGDEPVPSTKWPEIVSGSPAYGQQNAVLERYEPTGLRSKPLQGEKWDQPAEDGEDDDDKPTSVQCIASEISVISSELPNKQQAALQWPEVETNVTSTNLNLPASNAFDPVRIMQRPGTSDAPALDGWTSHASSNSNYPPNSVSQMGFTYSPSYEYFPSSSACDSLYMSNRIGNGDHQPAEINNKVVRPEMPLDSRTGNGGESQTTDMQGPVDVNNQSPKTKTGFSIAEIVNIVNPKTRLSSPFLDDSQAERNPLKRKVSCPETEPHNYKLLEPSIILGNPCISEPLLGTPSSYSQDAQRQIPLFASNHSSWQLSELPSTVDGSSHQEGVSESVVEGEPSRKRAKISEFRRTRTFATHAATALIGAMFGGVGTIALLASLPPDFFN